MADVFLSYKKEDWDLAADVVAAVRYAGYSVWWDEHISPRTAWDDVIEAEIELAKAVLVLWTTSSVQKKSFVRAEADYAKEKGKLISVRLTECSLPLAFRLVQTADLTTWDRKTQTNAQWTATLETIEELLRHAPATAEHEFSHSAFPIDRSLIGKAHSCAEMTALLEMLGTDFRLYRHRPHDRWYEPETTYSLNFRDHGVSLVFRGRFDEKAPTGLLGQVIFYSGIERGDRPWIGALPCGLKFSDSRRVAERKLGSPTAESGHQEHDGTRFRYATYGRTLVTYRGDRITSVSLCDDPV
jgi:hypothetical protein